LIAQLTTAGMVLAAQGGAGKEVSVWQTLELAEFDPNPHEQNPV